MPPDPAFLPEVPPSATVRQRLATAATEVNLLRNLLRLALRKEREEARLARLATYPWDKAEVDRA